MVQKFSIEISTATLLWKAHCGRLRVTLSLCHAAGRNLITEIQVYSCE